MKLSLLIFINLLIPAYLWNHELFLIFNGFHAPFADSIIGVIAGFGDGLVAILLLTTLMLFHLRLGLAAIAATALSGLVSQILKRIFDMPRPPVVLDDVHILGQSLSSHSFPSGHATTCGVLALLALLLWKHHKTTAWLLFAFFTLAAYGRIYGGVHFPLDVVVGFGIGLLCMWWCNHWSASWPVASWLESEWSWKLPGLLLLIAAVMLAMGYQVQPNTAQVLAFMLPVIALFTLMYAWKKKIS